MLYSLVYEARGATERRMFYAQSEHEAQEIVQKYAESHNIPVKELKMRSHPNGFRAGSRFYPPEERKRA